MWECALLTALKASSRVLWVAGAAVLLECDFLDGLLDEGFLFWGSAGGGTCSLFCFFPIFSKPSYRVSDIFMGAERKQGQLRLDRHASMQIWETGLLNAASFQTSSLLKIKLICETVAFLPLVACSPHIQGLTYPVHPPSMACVMGCYYPRQHSCNTHCSSQRSRVKHQENFKSSPECYLLSFINKLCPVQLG